MIDGSEKRNRQLGFELQNSHVCEKRSNSKYLFIYLFIIFINLFIFTFQASKAMYEAGMECETLVPSAKTLVLHSTSTLCLPLLA